MARNAMTRKRWMALLIPTLLMAAALPLWAQEKAPDAWHFEVSPYAWGPGFEGNLTIGEKTMSSQAGVSNLLDHLQFAFMGQFNARKGRWGIVVDPLYVSLGKAGSGKGAYSNIKADADFETFILGVGGYYRAYQGERGSFDILFGGRYNHVAADLHFNYLIPARHASNNYWDLFLGFKTDAKMSERWLFQFRAGAGGLATGSGTTWGAGLRFDCRLTRVSSLSFGYSYMDMEIRRGSGWNRLEADVQLGGPYLGLAFRF